MLLLESTFNHSNEWVVCVVHTTTDVAHNPKVVWRLQWVHCSQHVTIGTTSNYLQEVCIPRLSPSIVYRQGSTIFTLLYGMHTLPGLL